MKDLTEIVCLLDNSGSMQSIKNDIIGNFNSFIEAQKKDPQEAKLSLILFNVAKKVVHEALDLQTVPEFTSDGYRCTDGTALYDALGSTIDSVGKRLAAYDEADRPNKVIFVILTDGEENSSVTYSQEQISAMITEQQNVYSWQFIFLGSNQDAVLSAKSIGINSNNAMYFSNTSDSAMRAFTNVSASLSRSKFASAETYSSIVKDGALLDDEKDAR